MKPTLRILHLEDDRLHADLVSSMLEAEGFDVDVVLVETRKDFTETLDRGGFNIILADYTLPSYDGMSALEDAKNRCPEIPFIFVSGTMGEERTAEALKSGAVDYVLKNNMQRLIPAVKRALQEVEKISQLKKAEETNRIQSQRFIEVVNSIDALVYVVDMKTYEILLVNKFGVDTWGDIEGKICWQAIQKGQTGPCEFCTNDRLIGPDGKPTEGVNWEFQNTFNNRWYDCHDKAIYWPDGRIVRMEIATDITNRKRAEEALRESESKYRLLADNASDVIFVLDMNFNYTYVSPSVKILRGYEPEELINRPASETLTPSSLDLATRTLSEISKLEKSQQIESFASQTLQLEMKRKDETTLWTEVKVSFIRDENQQPVGILGVTRDITDRKRAEDELQRTLESLRRAIGTTIQVMVSAVETRDPYTAGHQIRSADLARAIATEMGLPQDQIDGIRIAGSIHDIGKLSIPAEILSRPTQLTDVEFALIKEHSKKGYEILKDVNSPWPLAQIIYQHHERIDGSGYPRNLKGDDILMGARILAVADVVESMASHRPYRPSLGIDMALEEIEKNKGTLYDVAVVDACLRLFREKGFQIQGVGF